MSKAFTRESDDDGLARAVLGARVGEVVTVRSPRGDEELEVMAVSYSSRA
jgi:transcription elongation GreA/GreB family factor